MGSRDSGRARLRPSRMTPWLAGKLAASKTVQWHSGVRRATHADQLWLRSADLASRMGSRDPGRARLRPSRMTPWLAGKLAFQNRAMAFRRAPATHADQLWLRSADLASRMGSRDSGRARLRPSRMAPWLAGKLALPKPCNGIQACLAQPIQLHFGFVRQISRAEWARVIPGGRGSVRAG